MSDQETTATAGVVGAPAQPVEGSFNAAETKFNKQQLIGSEKYRHRRDLLNVLLDDGTEYSIAEVDQKIEKFMTGEVK